jgi:hypothetical protein
MASYHQLIQGSTIEDSLNGSGGSIPRKAQHLAARLSKAVNALFIESEGHSANSWGQTRSVSENREAHLVELFTIALKLKAESVTTDCQYKFEIHRVGTAASGSQTDGRAGHIQFWKYATIHVYHGEASKPPNQFADALVNPKNFITKDEEAPWMRCQHSKSVLLQKRNPQLVQDNQFRAKWVGNAEANRYRRDEVGQILEGKEISLAGKIAIDVSPSQMGTASTTTAKGAITCSLCGTVFANSRNRNVHERRREFMRAFQGQGINRNRRILSHLC